uniref:Uncharacterized protein n=1 Tax=Haemonchus contortus TaxID=6289 RepID=A0A7I4YVF9_HAECO
MKMRLIASPRLDSLAMMNGEWVDWKVNAPAKVLLACVTALMLASNVASAANVVGHMSCIPGGVTITTYDVERYELCVEGNCHVKDNPAGMKRYTFHQMYFFTNIMSS